MVHERSEKAPEESSSGGLLARDTDRFRQDKEERTLDNTRLRIAIQKSGRLSDDSRRELSWPAAACGLSLTHSAPTAMAENMPIGYPARARDDDIPGLVMDGVVDLGIIGENRAGYYLPTAARAGRRSALFTLRRSWTSAAVYRWQRRLTKLAGTASAAPDGKRIATSIRTSLKRYLDQKVGRLSF